MKTFFNIRPYSLFHISFTGDEPSAGGGEPPKQDPPKSDPPANDTVSKDEYLKLQQKLEQLEAKQKEDERKANEKKGEYKKLYDEEKAKNDALAKDSEELKTLRDGMKKEFLDSLPETERETHKKVLDNINDVSLIRDYAKIHQKEETPGTDGGKPGQGKSISIKDKKYDDFTMAERSILADKQPDDYKKLYREKFGSDPVF